MQERRTGRFDARDARWSGGDITEEGAGRVLLDLAACQVTGLLELYARSRVYRLALRHGIPIHAFAGERPWLLGEVLAFLGAPIQGGMDQVRRVLALNPGRSGEVLVDQGVVRPKHLEWALKEQISLRAAEFLPLSEGRYRIWAGPQFLRNVPRQPDRWRPEELVASVQRPHCVNDDLRALLNRLGAGNPRIALGLPASASEEDVRSAFRSLAMAHHPDRIPPDVDQHRRNLHRLVFEASVRAFDRAKAA